MTKITLHQPEEDTPISTALFGCNMELTRRTAWSGLYAQMLNNRKFYAVTEDGVSGCGCPALWRRMDDTENSVCGAIISVWIPAALYDNRGDDRP